MRGRALPCPLQSPRKENRNVAGGVELDKLRKPLLLSCSDIIIEDTVPQTGESHFVLLLQEHLLHIQLHEPLTAIAPGTSCHSIKMICCCWGRDYSKKPDNYQTARNNLCRQVSSMLRPVPSTHTGLRQTLPKRKPVITI